MKNVLRLVKNKKPEVRFHARAKANNSDTVLRCKHCLELSKFRVVQLDGVNALACIICLNSTRYYKHNPIKEHDIIFKGKFTWRHKLERQYRRIKVWFTGDHITAPFGIRRRKIALFKIQFIEVWNKLRGFIK